MPIVSLLRASVVTLLATLTWSAAFAPVASAQRCEAPEVMIVVDRSSSMAASRSGLLSSGHSKWGAAREAIAALATGYAEGVDFGVTVYPAVDGANSCDPGAVTLPVGGHSADALLAAVPSDDPPYAGNWTATSQTLDALLTEGFVDDPDTTRERHVILITDGEQCCYRGGSTCLAEQRFWPVDSVVRLRDMGITTHVIGFGSGVDALDAQPRRRRGRHRASRLRDGRHRPRITRVLLHAGERPREPRRRPRRDRARSHRRGLRRLRQRLRRRRRQRLRRGRRHLHDVRQRSHDARRTAVHRAPRLRRPFGRGVPRRRRALQRRRRRLRRRGRPRLRLHHGRGARVRQ